MSRYDDISLVSTRDLKRDLAWVRSVRSGKTPVYGEGLMDSFDDDYEAITHELLCRRFKKQSM